MLGDVYFLTVLGERKLLLPYPLQLTVTFLATLSQFLEVYFTILCKDNSAVCIADELSEILFVLLTSSNTLKH